MMAMKPALDLFIDANIVFLLAFCLWSVVQALVSRTVLKHNYPAQLRLMKIALIVTMISPVMAHVAVSAGQFLWPKTPITVSDIAVASYLRGEISIPAVEFEALLNMRGRVLDALFAGEAPWLMALIAVFAAGALVQGIRLTASAASVGRAVGNSYVWRRIGRVDIRLSDTVSVPFAARGFRRHYVVLPSTLVTEPREMRLILAHELQHLRDGDVEWELAFEVMRPLMFWNPAFGFWKRSFDKLRELSCDQKVVARQRIGSQDYMDCLIGFCERQVTGPLPRAMHVAFFRAQDRSSKHAFRERIMALTNRPNSARMRLALPVLSCLLAVGVSLAAASVRQPGDWSQDRLMLSTIVNLERLEAINRR
ncbi:biotin transporter BioY [Alphaproteobacteria bacterium GH1-50]|uniref:Biotin transporter BioY n=1 Tax=Kangsaoukella pontilimi TaxID=2691042 RepID=A0A7C9MJ15_9RHOB|nr:M56 family metallopeptidase [Kangsaoukella pontilimi]MXQ07415.1 biotin transporter BioY [Kangsaoukella pontilimi]